MHRSGTRAAEKLSCGSGAFVGLSKRMRDFRPHLRVLPPPPVAAAARCAAPGCHLPIAAGGGEFGLCWACERVYRCAMVLCDRLLERDVARLEHDTPGITAAARAALTGPPHPPAKRPGSACGCGRTVGSGARWEALLPLPGDLDELNDFLSELDAALRMLGAMP